jgi:uncharacterized protein (DUF1330 family)
VTVYAIATLNIHDRSTYADYESGFMAALENYDAKILSVDESPLVLEGQWPFTRTVILEFSDADELQRWYGSEAYQAILPHRQAASDGHVVVVNGLPS